MWKKIALIEYEEKKQLFKMKEMKYLKKKRI